MSPEYNWIVTVKLPDGKTAREVQKAISLLQGVESIKDAPQDTRGEVPTITKVDLLVNAARKLEAAGHKLDDGVLLQDLRFNSKNSHLSEHSIWAEAGETLSKQERVEVGRIIGTLTHNLYNKERGLDTVGKVRHTEDLMNYSTDRYARRLGPRSIQFARTVFG